MELPFYIPLVFFKIHPHFFFECLAYCLGFRLYLKYKRPALISTGDSLWILVGISLGAAFGSKILFLLEDPITLLKENSFEAWIGGKTIVGGLLGGLIGVEIIKKLIGYTKSTGDDIVFPLIFGMVLGRIGCFLSGLEDHTHGIETSLWWGFNYGDGLYRHPTQLYEIFILLLIFCFLKKKKAKKNYQEGELFKFFLIFYLMYRFFIDFYKPVPHVYGGISAIQLACLGGLFYYHKQILEFFRFKKISKANPA